jgi:glycosyltransferase involved in cell wall biosynthesis
LRLRQIKSWLAHRQAHYIVTVSDHAKAGILRHFHHPPERVWVVGEAPASVFQPRVIELRSPSVLSRIGLDRSNRFIICLGGLNPHKNLDIVVTALAELRQDEQFADLQLVLVGPAEDDLFTPGAADLRRQVTEMNLESVIHFTGYLPDEDVVDLLNTATVFAMPSLDEGFGLGAVEAAACGLPVIATRNSPLPRLLEGGGLFVDPTKPHEILEALRDLLINEAHRQKMGQVALTKARSLTWQRAAQQFNDLLTTIESTRP